MFRRNVGGFDRAARVVWGIFLLLSGQFALGEHAGAGWTLTIIGLIALITGIVGFCPPYVALGISTARSQRQASTDAAQGKGPRLRRILRTVGAVAALGLGLAALGSGLVAFEILSREPPAAVASTTHHSIGRQECIDCHAPIAEEWRQSYHYRSLTGQYWKDVRDLGYMKIFDRTRKACVNCHSPANVLDLAAPSATHASASHSLGVECTPNLLREPRGVIPAVRADHVELGVDCTSCHVSKRGIVGAGRHTTEVHETVADERFQNASVTADTLCRTCHSSTVDVWNGTRFAATGVTCMDCHMPETNAPSVAGGPERRRRSHRFAADKDPGMLDRAVNASLTITPDRKALFRITNDRVGHLLPSGGNWLFVQFKAYDASGRMLSERREDYGKRERLFLDFWPFNTDQRIAPDEKEEVLFPLPEGHGTAEVVIRYHDFIGVNPVVTTLKETY